MKFAENNRISHRQLYRQMILTFPAPFLLCLFGNEKIMGMSGIVGTVSVAGVLVLYVIFLIRQGPYYMDLKKTAGPFWARLIGIFFLSYVIVTGAYLTALLTQIVPESLLVGVSEIWVAFVAVAVCSVGTHKGMQRRGRMAEMAGGFFLLCILLILLLCLGQSRVSYFQEMLQNTRWSLDSYIRNGYGVLCAFSGISLLPFLLEHVEKQGSAWKTVVAGILTTAGIVIAMLCLLPAILGWKRMQTERYPVLPLLAGANLPGNVLARFDVLWMGFLLFGLLFALGSLIYYSRQIIEKTHLGRTHYWVSGAILFLGISDYRGIGIREVYGSYLGYFFVPVLILVQFVLILQEKDRKRRKTAVSVAVLLFSMWMSGCGGIEPEKRMYPFAIGIDLEGENLSVVYGMPNLPQATGQEKEESGEKKSALSLIGRDFAEIEKLYNRSQEKYLDMGHLRILVLGKQLMESQRWKDVLLYLAEEPFVGEDIYVFQAENLTDVFEWQSLGGTSLGEYVTGVMENKTPQQRIEGITLRSLYYQMAENGNLPNLPKLMVQEEQLQILSA